MKPHFIKVHVVYVLFAAFSRRSESATAFRFVCVFRVGLAGNSNEDVFFCDCYGISRFFIVHFLGSVALLVLPANLIVRDSLVPIDLLSWSAVDIGFGSIRCF